MLPRVNLVRTDSTDYLLFSTDDLISRYIIKTGQWESVNLLLAQLLCEGIEQPLVLDVGANLGAFTVPLAQKLVNKGGLIYAFEPQRIIYYQLCANIFLNRLDCCIAKNVAIGDEEGILELQDVNYAQSSNIGGYSLVEEYQERINSEKPSFDAIKHKIPVHRLDSLDFPRKVSFIKIDVEGMEIQVLKGATRLLRESDYPPILFEAWNEDWYKVQRRELIEYIEGLGYEVFFFNEMDAIAQHKSSKRFLKFMVDSTSNVLSYSVINNP